jgi:hypothetical protein
MNTIPIGATKTYFLKTLPIFLNNLNITRLAILGLKKFITFLLHICANCYIFLKIFKVICYLKLTIDWFPLINPYSWPFSLLRLITRPYFKFWLNVLPYIRFHRTSLNVAHLIAIESLTSFITVSTVLITQLTTFLTKADKYLTTLL